ncbi:MAG: DUF1343 domain-containing protein [Bdellovibrionales bacterium]|nr:DUF1343 domain-containing protein [Oligoflexia bacterium]
MIHFGIDRLLEEKDLQKKLEGKRLGLLAHPASVTADLTHSLDAIKHHTGLNLTCAFGPQHGMRGEKQYNMVESEDYLDPVHQIPVFSLYGKTRRPTAEMLEHCDGVLVDLQDLGCRIYTYLTSLLYMMEACAQLGKFVWVLDRPNPAGRKIEGSILKAGNESFVGAGPIIMRHGMTLGELARFMKREYQIKVDLTVVEMKNYAINQAPGFGWPLEERAWVNPSPNVPVLSVARCYAGTVMIEGTTLSEGRGTTRPLEGFGAPDIEGERVLQEMRRLAPQWLEGCLLRPYYFEPTFYKYQGMLCSGVQIHVDYSGYEPKKFQAYRVMALAFKSIRNLYPKYELWRDFPYEYVFDRLAIDVITGCDTLRNWVDDPTSTIASLESFLSKDEDTWKALTQNDLIY